MKMLAKFIKLLSTLILLISLNPVQAALPPALNYQGFLTDDKRFTGQA